MLIHSMPGPNYSHARFAEALEFSQSAPNNTQSASTTEDEVSPPARSVGPDGSNEKALEQDERAQLQVLRNRDREVRAHEQAHVAAAGALAISGPALDFQRRPDGRLYAVGGEVHIDTSAEAGDPEATLNKARQIERAALAPAQPSAQDRTVAAPGSGHGKRGEQRTGEAKKRV